MTKPTTLSPEEIGARLKTVMGVLEDLSEQMNDSASPCKACGVSIRENMDDYRAKQSLDAVLERLGKMYSALFDGAWHGREIAPVVTAESIRGRS